MSNVIALDLDLLANVYGGKAGAKPEQAAPPPPPPPANPAPQAPQQTESGNLCRDVYRFGGAALGGLATIETGGWGAVPGLVAGEAAGRTFCRP